MISIQFILKRSDYSETNLKENSTDLPGNTTSTTNTPVGNVIYTNPKIFGPSNIDTISISNPSSCNIIDEIVLELADDEEIYLIKGLFEKGKGGKKNQITKMGIYTTFGQFVEFGKSPLEYNFTWEYFFNLRFFDGFIIGWNDRNITYLASLVVEKLQANYDEKNIVLTDTTYIRSYFVEPMYLSPRYGTIDANTFVIDDLTKMKLLNDIQSNDPWYISEIAVYFDKMINCVEVEYTNRKSLVKVKSCHMGNESKEIYVYYVYFVFSCVK